MSTGNENSVRVPSREMQSVTSYSECTPTDGSIRFFWINSSPYGEIGLTLRRLLVWFIDIGDWMRDRVLPSSIDSLKIIKINDLIKLCKFMRTNELDWTWSVRVGRPTGWEIETKKTNDLIANWLTRARSKYTLHSVQLAVGSWHGVSGDSVNVRILIKLVLSSQRWRASYDQTNSCLFYVKKVQII